MANSNFFAAAPAPPTEAPQAADDPLGAYGPIYRAAGSEYGVDPYMLRAQGIVESGEDPAAVGDAGEVGVMQLRPGTARDMGVSNPLSPWQNIFGGAKYLRQQLDTFNDPARAISAYNAGPEGQFQPKYVRNVVDQYTNLKRRAPLRDLTPAENETLPPDEGAAPTAPASAAPQHNFFEAPAAEATQPAARNFFEVPGEPPQSTAAALGSAAAQGAVMGAGAAVSGASRFVQMTGPRLAQANLEAMDRIDRGEHVSMLEDPLGYQNMSDAKRAETRQRLSQELQAYLPPETRVNVNVPIGPQEGGGAPTPLDTGERAAPVAEAPAEGGNAAVRLGVNEMATPYEARGLPATTATTGRFQADLTGAQPRGVGVSADLMTYDPRTNTYTPRQNETGEYMPAGPMPETAGTRLGERISQFGKETFPVAPEQEGVATGLARMGGGLLPIVLGAAAATAAGAPEAGAALIGTTIFSQSYDSTYRDATAHGATPLQADRAALENAAAQGSLMVTPIFRALDNLPALLRDGALRTLVNMGRHGVEFGSFNAMGQFIDNYVANQSYDPSRPLTEGVAQSALEGTVMGIAIPAGAAFARNIIPALRFPFQPVTARPEGRPPGAGRGETPPPEPGAPPRLPGPAPGPEVPPGAGPAAAAPSRPPRRPRPAAAPPTPGSAEDLAAAVAAGAPAEEVVPPSVAPEVRPPATPPVAEPMPPREVAAEAVQPPPALPAPTAETAPPEAATPAAPTRIRTVDQIMRDDGIGAKAAAAKQGEEIAAIGRPITMDEMAARRAGVAALPSSVPGVPPLQPSEPRDQGYPLFTPAELTTEPGVMQFKTSDERGVTGALTGFSTWEPALANPITVWQANDGRNVVVNGHQRLDLAQRAEAAGQQGVQLPARVYREADGYTPEYMRALGAYQNIAEGSGTPLDAARVLRTKNAFPESMRLPELPPHQMIVQQARGLAQLSPDAFGAVENGLVPPEYAGMVGAVISDPAEQMAALDTLSRGQPANANQARIMIADIRNSGFLQGAQTTLFGDEAFARSLVPERAKVLDGAMKILRSAAAAFRATVKGEETLTAAGNVLAGKANVEGKTASERLLDTIGRNATTVGPYSDALNVAARELAAGKPIKTVAHSFLAAARELERGGTRAGVPAGDHGRGVGHAGESEPEAVTDAGPGLLEAIGRLAQPPIKDERQGKLFLETPKTMPKPTGKLAEQGVVIGSEAEDFTRFAQRNPGVSPAILAGRYVLERGRETGHEYLTAYDPHLDSVIMAHTIGKAARVNFPRGFEDASTDPSRALVVHHNHPGSNSLSSDDVYQLSLAGISSVVAHGHDGSFYAASLGPAADRSANTPTALANGLALGSLKAEQFVSNGLLKAIKAGEATKEELQAVLWDTINRVLHNAGMIDYVAVASRPPHVAAIADRVAAAAIRGGQYVGDNRHPDAASADEGIARVVARSADDSRARRSAGQERGSQGPGLSEGAPSDATGGTQEAGVRGLAEPRGISDPRWHELLRRGKQQDQQAAELAAAGKPVRGGPDKYGLSYLVSPDVHKPGSGEWRTTTFRDGVPQGHIEHRNALEAFTEALRYGHIEPIRPYFGRRPPLPPAGGAPLFGEPTRPTENLYRPLLRPAGFESLPRGVKWDFVEAPQMHGLANRPDLPQSQHRYGIIRTDRPLTAEETKHFDLEPVGGKPGPEPTIRTDERQLAIPGTEASAVQAQAARDQAGRGALLPTGEQRPANEGLFAPKLPEQKPLFGRREAPRVPLYSAVERAVTGLKQEKGTGEQFAAMLAKVPGVKPEEMKWLGLDSWLRGQKTVTKQQIADYVRANSLDVREVERGEARADFDRLYDETVAAGTHLRGLLPDTLPEPVIARGSGVERPVSVAEGVVHALAMGWVKPDEMPAQYRDAARAYVEASTREDAARAPAGGPAKYAGYQLPGGQNYRELLITLPPQPRETAALKEPLPPGYEVRGNALGRGWEVVRPADATPMVYARGDTMAEAIHSFRGETGWGASFRSPHWDEPNVLGHVRFSERRAPDGKRVLHLEELQSDYGQAARKRGVRDAAEISRLEREHDAVSGRMDAMSKDRDTTTNVMRDEKGWHAAARERDAIGERLRAAQQALPDLPFRTTWPALLMRRMIKYAVDNGVDRIAWTPGDEQAKRYDLSKLVRALHYSRDGELEAFGHNGERLLSQRAAPEALPDVVGKEAAEKLLAAKPHPASGMRALEGVDLKVGGEGMRGFYDRILPAETQKIIGKFGAKVGESKIAVRGDNEAAWRRDAANMLLDAASRAEREGANYGVVRQLTSAAGRIEDADADVRALQHGIGQEAGRFIQSAGGWPEFGATERMQSLHSFDITPALRNAVMEQGLPLFQRGEAMPGHPDYPHPQTLAADLRLEREAGAYAKLNTEAGYDRYRRYRIVDGAAKDRGYVSTSYDNNTGVVKIQSTAATGIEKGGPNAFGARAVIQLRDQLLADHPDAKRIAGLRISGARAGRPQQISMRVYPHPHAIQAVIDAARAITGGHIRIEAYDAAHHAFTVKFPDGHTEQVFGYAIGRLIRAAIEPGRFAQNLNHEVLHALKRLGVFTKAEWATLEATAERGNWIEKHGVLARYPEMDHAGHLEEAIADELGERATAAPTPGATPSFIARMLAKVRSFIARLRNMLARRGFQTADDVFGRALSGEVGARRPGSGMEPVGPQSVGESLEAARAWGLRDPAETEAALGRREGSATDFDWTPGGGYKQALIGDTVIEYAVSRDGKGAEISHIGTPSELRNQGSARKAMEHFVADADRKGVTLFLTAEPMGKGVTKAGLDRLYRSLGFVKNTGRNKDFSSRGEFVRQPRPPTDLAFGRRQTETPEFRHWFSDSKVVDAAGEPKRMFHGSRTPGIEAFSREHASPEAMYGPGFYFTDSPDVAGSTGGGRDEHEIAAKAAFSQAGYAWQAAHYDSAPLTPRQMARAKRLLWSKQVLRDAHEDIGTRQTTGAGQRAVLTGEPQFREWLSNGGWRWLRETLGVERQPTTSPTTYPVYLSIKRPFEADVRVTADGARSMVKAMIAAAPREGLPAWRTGEANAAIERRIQGWGDAVPQSAAFEAVAAELGKTGAMEALQRAGYDGVHMEGGNTIGTFGQHDVWVAFDPTQIKSAVGNVGTFDPNDPRLAFGRRPVPFTPSGDAAKLEEAARAMGFQRVRHEVSGLSNSHYVTVDDKGGAESAKIRVADHDLPTRYEGADYEVGPFAGAHGDRWTDAVRFLGRKFGRKPTTEAARAIASEDHEAAQAAEREAARGTLPEPLRPFAAAAAAAIPDPSSRAAGWLRDAQKAFTEAGAPREIVEANQPAIVDWLQKIARERQQQPSFGRRSTDVPGPDERSEESPAFGRQQRSLPLATARERFAVAKKAADEMKQLFAPTSRGKEAKATEHMIRSHAAQRAQSVAQSTEALERFAHVVGRLPVEEQLAITDRAEAGEKQPTPELNRIMDAVRAEQEKWVGKVRSLGPQYLQTLRENYMGRIWANYREWRAGVDADAAQQMAEGRGIAEAQARGKSPLKGSGAFLKRRTFDTQREGMEAGLVPVTTNPIEMQLLKLYEMARFYHGVRLSDAIKDSGLAAWVPFHTEGYVRERGFVKLDDPSFQPRVVGQGEYGRKEYGNWWAPEPVARVFNNFVSRGLAGHSTIYDTVRGASNALNSAQLSFSGFHATFVAFDTMMSKMALGLQQLSRGEPLRGAATMGKALSPTTIVSTILKGGALREAYLHPDQATPEMRKLVQALIAGGGRIKMDPFYQSTAAGSFVKRMGDLLHPGAMLHDAWQMAKDSPVAAPMRIVGRLLDTLNHPLMGIMVPRAKLGVFSELAADFLRRNPEATPEQLADAMTKAWDSVDNRMGQLVYDNLFWSKVQKDLAFLTTRSVGWNLGSVREIGGAVVDLAAQAGRVGKGVANVARGRRFGMPPELTNRMAYTIAMPIITAMFGALVTYLVTGEPPKERLDYFYPPTGTGERTTMPGYIKDVMAFRNDPLGTVGNKTQPLLETLIEIKKNRDYFGGIINMPGVDNPLVSYPEYLLNQAIPFSWRGWMRSREESGSILSQALNFWGIQPAPQSITNPERGEAYQQKQDVRAIKERMKENAKGRINFDSAP